MGEGWGRNSPRPTNALAAVRAWATTSGAHATGTMQPTYLQHGLEPDEVLALVAYLEDADREGPADNSALSLKFLLLGVGGTVLGLLTLSTLWGSRSRQRDAATHHGESTPVAPAERDSE